MPAYTDAQAQSYYNTLTPQQQQDVDAAGGPTVAWLTNAVDAGVPDAISAVGGGDIQEKGWEIEGGKVADPTGANALPPSAWLGKRNPTPSELRRYSREAGWSEDFARYSDRQMAAWINEGWDTSINKFKGGVEKPTETGGTSAPGMGGRGGGGFGGGGYGMGKKKGGAPTLDLPEFVAPTMEEALSDPGYQFALQQGQEALEGSAAARGTLRTGGTLRDLVDYGQQAAQQQYGDVYNRALQGYGANVGAMQAEFAPQFQAYQQQQDLGYNRWATQYGGNLQKYLQREGNIFGLLNTPPPAYPGY